MNTIHLQVRTSMDESYKDFLEKKQILGTRRHDIVLWFVKQLFLTKVTCGMGT